MSSCKVTKSDIVDKVHESTKVEKKLIHEVFESIVEEFKNATIIGRKRWDNECSQRRLNC